MSFETGLISFAALTCLALAMRKHRSQVALPYVPPAQTVRVLGWTLLTLSAVAAVGRFGVAQGLAAWVGQMGVAGVSLVLLMSWRPAVAPVAAGLALACAPLVGLA